MLVKRSFFPLRKIRFSIDGSIFQIKPGEVLKIDLATKRKHSLTVYMDWIEITKKLELNNDKTLKIKHIIPDVYYLLGLSSMVLLFFLFIVGIIPVVPFSIAVILFVTPVLLISIFKRGKYFTLETT